MIYVGIDDTDIVGGPGTNQLGRAILRALGADCASGAVLCRHQLFFDPRVPYTSKNGSASIQLPHVSQIDRDDLVPAIRNVMRAWFVDGSDPGLCVATAVPDAVIAFARRCQSQVVTQEETRAVAERAGCHLEALGGTGQGIIGALAAVGLVATGDDGRVVHLSGWPYPDDEFSGPRSLQEIFGRGIAEVRERATGRSVRSGTIDLGKHLRPSWSGGRIVLFVERATDPGVAPWRALKLP